MRKNTILLFLSSVLFFSSAVAHESHRDYVSSQDLIVTDQGISGYGEAESYKPYLKPMVLFYKDYLLGEDPTDVQRVMRSRSTRRPAMSASDVS